MILNGNIFTKLRPQSPKNFKHRVSIAGREYGHLLVYGLAGYHIKERTGYWLCQCLCGNWSIVNRNKLGRKRTTSCGCRSTVQRTHGMSKTPIYRQWTDMLTRVRNPREKQFHNYGGRGIRACLGFQRFEHFFAVLGFPPKKHQTDRIQTNGHYSCGTCPECIEKGWPLNVRWSSSKNNNRNRRNNHLLTINSETRCISEWSEISGVQTATAHYRLKRNWTPEQAFDFKEPPSRKRAA